MRDLEQYRRNLEFCLTNAAKAPFSELRAIWQTLAESYTFLIALESDPRHTGGNARAVQSALRADPLNDHSAADRIPL